MDEALVMRKVFRDAAKETLDEILDKHMEEKANKKKAKKKNNAKKDGKKKKKTPKRPTVVGIHSRRTDHLSYELEKGKEPLKASYFFRAMDMFRCAFRMLKSLLTAQIRTINSLRDFLGDVVFVYISDDVAWGKENLAKRNRLGDLYFASSGQPGDNSRSA